MEVKVLVIEDNLKLSKKICSMLKIEGFQPYCADNLARAEQLFIEENPKILLLDIMLPDGKGYDLIKLFKAKFNCWIIIMTALSDVDSKKLCYQLGADDYITKPFDLFELIYKLNALRKMIVRNLKVYSIGDIIINEETSEIIKGDYNFRVPSSHIKLIKVLFEKYKSGSYLSKIEMQNENLEECKDINRIHTFVSRVRKNLKQVKSEQVFIETIYGKGYILDIINLKGSNDAK